jgi:flavorubredoxin
MLPADDGDCFFVETGNEDYIYRILIDGGRRRCSREYLRPLIACLPLRDGPSVDLVVITHIDSDHVEGLLDLLMDDALPSVGEIWFNDLHHLKIARGEPQRSQPSRCPPVAIGGAS